MKTWLFSSLVVFAASAAQAQLDRGSFATKPQLPAVNLLKESEAVQVLSETSVQMEEFSTRRVYALNYAQLSAERLILTSYDHKVDYDLKAPLTMLGAEFGYYPWQWRGYWGFRGAAAYGYREHNAGDDTKTMLHVAMGDLLLMYRGELDRSNWLKPFAGVGGTVITVFQRGREGYNTSEARGMYLGVLGVGLNLNRVFGLSSGIGWELVTQYKRIFGPSKSAANWNGSIWNAGFSIAL